MLNLSATNDAVRKDGVVGSCKQAPIPEGSGECSDGLGRIDARDRGG
jgi:hypothetical protein